MIRKIILILSLYYAMQILQSCFLCEEVEFPFFDFHSINVVSAEVEKLFTNYYEFQLILKFDSVEHVAYHNPSNFINTAYALSCEYDGDEGLKYNIDKINIFADSIFVDSIPKTEPLNTLFNISFDSDRLKYPLDSISNQNQSFYISQFSQLLLSTKTTPVDINYPYSFTLEVIKENGDTVTTIVEEVIWDNQ